jgi:bacteriorhodopsin
MKGAGFISTAFLVLGLCLMILAYSNKKLVQRPNQTFLMLGVIMLLLWFVMFIVIELGGPF